MRTRPARLLLTVAFVAVGLWAAPAEAQISPDAAFTVTVDKTVTGLDDPGEFDFELVCSSDDGVGESSFVSIDDPTFPGFESSDSVVFDVGDGDDETFTVYVEFSRQTVITCRVDETGGDPEPASTTVSCVADALVECADPAEGDAVEQAFGEATLSWVDLPDAPIESAGGATFSFTNDYVPATTTTAAPTTTTTAAAAAAATATPRFTG